jgi:hypothetical protein
MSIEHWWTDTDRETPKYSEKHLSKCHFVQHKSYMDWPGIESGPPRKEAGDSCQNQRLRLARTMYKI